MQSSTKIHKTSLSLDHLWFEKRDAIGHQDELGFRCTVNPTSLSWGRSHYQTLMWHARISAVAATASKRLDAMHVSNHAANSLGRWYDHAERQPYQLQDVIMLDIAIADHNSSRLVRIAAWIDHYLPFVFKHIVPRWAKRIDFLQDHAVWGRCESLPFAHVFANVIRTDHPLFYSSFYDRLDNARKLVLRQVNEQMGWLRKIEDLRNPASNSDSIRQHDWEGGKTRLSQVNRDIEKLGRNMEVLGDPHRMPEELAGNLSDVCRGINEAYDWHIEAYIKTNAQNQALQNDLQEFEQLIQAQKEERNRELHRCCDEMLSCRGAQLKHSRQLLELSPWMPLLRGQLKRLIQPQPGPVMMPEDEWSRTMMQQELDRRATRASRRYEAARDSVEGEDDGMKDRAVEEVKRMVHNEQAAQFRLFNHLKDWITLFPGTELQIWGSADNQAKEILIGWEKERSQLDSSQEGALNTELDRAGAVVLEISEVVSTFAPDRTGQRDHLLLAAIEDSVVETWNDEIDKVVKQLTPTLSYKERQKCSLLECLHAQEWGEWELESKELVARCFPSLIGK